LLTLEELEKSGSKDKRLTDLMSAVRKLHANPKRLDHKSAKVQIDADGNIIDPPKDDPDLFGVRLGPDGNARFTQYMNRCTFHSASPSSFEKDGGYLKPGIDGITLTNGDTVVEIKEAFKDSGAVCVILDDENCKKLALKFGDSIEEDMNACGVHVWICQAVFLGKALEVAVAKCSEVWPGRKTVNVIGTQLLNHFFSADDPRSAKTTFYRYSPVKARKRKELSVSSNSASSPSSSSSSASSASSSGVVPKYGCDPQVQFIPRKLPPFGKGKGAEEAEEYVQSVKDRLKSSKAQDV